MADPEQVERLERNVTEWNQWREGHPKIRPDLNSADFRDTDLRGANLNDADLNGADLRGASLIQASLFGADLRGANLSSAMLLFANLSNANLFLADLSSASLSSANLFLADAKGVNLSGASLFTANLTGLKLSSADLGRADLSNANLSSADLSETNFCRTTFAGTIFTRVDLSNAKELKTARHEGPSSIDINTVILPHDEPTRLHFLRGIGFTDTQIEYLPSLLTPRPIEYSSLFISCSHKDDIIAKRLYNDLRKKDVPCWFAPHDLRPGTLMVRGIEEAIHKQDKLLLILSHHAVNSNWVQYEVESALHKQATSGRETLFPIRLDNAILESKTGWARRLCKHHIGDFTNWQDDAAYNQAFTTLLKHLKVDKTPNG